MDWELFVSCAGFQWDEGNRDKNWEKHRVSDAESEQAFFNFPLVFGDDVAHSRDEPRCYALGKTNAGRLLFVGFTIRGTLIRIITAREMTRKEKKRYGTHK